MGDEALTAEECGALLREAEALLGSFTLNPNREHLCQAMEALVDVLHVRRADARALMLLGYGFYVLNDDSQARKYVQLAVEADEEAVRGDPKLVKMRELIERGVASDVRGDADKALELTYTETGGILRVEVVQARNLLGKNLFGGNSDPYVRLELGKRIVKTRFIPGNLDPEWHEMFEFDVPGTVSETSLNVTVWDRDRFTKDEFLGMIEIPLRDVQGKETVDEWYTLGKRSAKSRVRGDLRLKLSLRDSDGGTTLTALNINSMQGVVSELKSPAFHNQLSGVINVANLSQDAVYHRDIVRSVLPALEVVLGNTHFDLYFHGARAFANLAANDLVRVELANADAFKMMYKLATSAYGGDVSLLGTKAIHDMLLNDLTHEQFVRSKGFTSLFHVAQLDSSDLHRLVAKSLHALFCSEDTSEDNYGEFLAAGGMPILFSFLQHPDEEVMSEAARVLDALSEYDACRTAMLQSNVLEVLLKLMASSDVEVHRSVSGVFIAFTYTLHHARKLVLDVVGLSQLAFHFVYSGDDIVRENALTVLCNLCSYEELQAQLLADNIMQSLIFVARLKDVDVHVLVLRCIVNLARNNTDDGLVVRSGGVDAIAVMMQEGIGDEEVQEWGCHAIRNLLVDSIDHSYLALVGINCVDLLLSALSRFAGNSALVDSCMVALRVLFQEERSRQRTPLRRGGVLHALCLVMTNAQHTHTTLARLEACIATRFVVCNTIAGDMAARAQELAELGGLRAVVLVMRSFYKDSLALLQHTLYLLCAVLGMDHLVDAHRADLFCEDLCKALERALFVHGQNAGMVAWVAETMCRYSNREVLAHTAAHGGSVPASYESLLVKCGTLQAAVKLAPDMLDTPLTVCDILCSLANVVEVCTDDVMMRIWTPAAEEIVRAVLLGQPDKQRYCASLCVAYALEQVSIEANVRGAGLAEAMRLALQRLDKHMSIPVGVSHLAWVWALCTRRTAEATLLGVWTLHTLALAGTHNEQLRGRLDTLVALAQHGDASVASVAAACVRCIDPSALPAVLEQPAEDEDEAAKVEPTCEGAAAAAGKLLAGSVGTHTVSSVVSRATTLITVRTDDLLDHVINVLAEGRVLSVPVLDADDKCVGLLDMMDIVAYMAMVAPEDGAASEEQVHVFRGRLQKEKAVDIINTSGHNPYITVHESDALSSLVQPLCGDAHRVVVVDGDGMPVRVLSQTDVVRHLHSWATSQGSVLSHSTVLRDPIESVPGLETVGVKGVRADWTMMHCVQEMTTAALSCAAVTNESGTLIAQFGPHLLKGIVSDSIDLLLRPLDEYLREKSEALLFYRSEYTLQDVLESLVERKAHSAWRINEEGEPVALITLSDIVQLCAPPPSE